MTQTSPLQNPLYQTLLSYLNPKNLHILQSPTQSLVVSQDILSYIQDDHIAVYHEIMKYYAVKVRYLAFRMFVEVQAILFRNGHRDSLHDASLHLAGHVLPVLHDFISQEWMREFENRFVRRITMEQFMENSMRVLKHVPPSRHPVTYHVTRLIDDSHRETRIRILKNGFVLRGVHVCSSMEVSQYAKQRVPLGDYRLIVITWTWNFTHIKTSAELYLHVNDMAKSLAASGVRVVLCANDPRHLDVVVQCFDQQNILLLWSEQVDLEVCALCLGEESLVEVEEHLSLLQKKDSKFPRDIYVQLMQQHTPQQSESTEDDGTMIWAVDRDTTDSHEYATILVFGSLEEEVEPLFNEIQGQLSHLSTYTAPTEKEVSVVDGGCFLEGHLIHYLKHLAKELMLGSKTTTVDKHSKMLLSKLCKTLCNVLEEEPIDVIKTFAHSSQEMTVLKEWYDNVAAAVAGDKTSNTRHIFLTDSGLQTVTKTQHLWKEKFHMLHATFELLGILLRTRIELKK